MTSKKQLTYFQKRMLKIKKDSHSSSDDYIQKLTKRYVDLSNSIEKEMNYFISRFSDERGIDFDAAKEMLSKNEQKEWQLTLEEFKAKALAGGYISELNRKYFKRRLTRLERLNNQLYFTLADMAANEETLLSEHLAQQLQETYYRNIFEMTDRGSFSISFSTFDERSLRQILSEPWKGATFSERIWKNHLKTLPNKLNKVFADATINGWGIDRMIQEMMGGINDSLRNRMATLVQTESAHLADIATHQSYKETGVTSREWLATLERSTCAVCGGLDGKEFDVDDESAPRSPIHPNCRCTDVPVIDGWDSMSRWERNPETGRGKLEENLTFEKWKKINDIDNVKVWKKESFKVRQNREIYELYKEVIGEKNMTVDFKQFNRMKNRQTNTWKLLKDYKRARGKHHLSSFTSFDDYRKQKALIEKNIVGLTASDGLVIKSQSKHFIDRYIGTTHDLETKRFRTGVEMSAVIQALKYGIVEESNSSKTVLRYTGEQAIVTVNKVTGNLIQVNPTRGSSRNKRRK